MQQHHQMTIAWFPKLPADNYLLIVMKHPLLNAFVLEDDAFGEFIDWNLNLFDDGSFTYCLMFVVGFVGPA